MIGFEIRYFKQERGEGEGEEKEQNKYVAMAIQLVAVNARFI